MPPATRRQILAGLSAAAALTADAEKARASVDADLIQAVQMFHEIHAASKNVAGLSDQEIFQIDDMWLTLVDRVHGLLPRTVEGMQAKSGVALLVLMDRLEAGNDPATINGGWVVDALPLGVLSAAAGLNWG